MNVKLAGERSRMNTTRSEHRFFLIRFISLLEVTRTFAPAFLIIALGPLAGLDGLRGTTDMSSTSPD